jgi:hypothetical protein
VVPPLSRATAQINVLAARQSAETHATLPLCRGVIFMPNDPWFNAR